MRKALLCLFACLFAAGAAMAQNAAPQAAPPMRPPHTKIIRAMPPGTIDGKDHPELIPDLMAYRLFFVQVTLPDRPTPDDSRRHEAKLGIIGLSDFDRVILELAVSNFHNRYAFFLEQYKTAAVDDAAIAQRDAITQDAINYLQNSMSASGWQRFSGFIQNEKRHMKRIPMPAMN